MMLAYIVLVNGFSEQSDDDGHNDGDDEEDAAEVEVMNVTDEPLDDLRSRVNQASTTRGHRVAKLESKANHSNR